MAELQRRLTAAGSTLRVDRRAPGLDGDRRSPGQHRQPRSRPASATYGIKLVGMPAWQGALPTLYAATMDVPGNTYVGPHRLREMNGWPTGVGRSQQALDPDLAKALWAESERAERGRRSRSDAGQPTVTDSISTGLLGRGRRRTVRSSVPLRGHVLRSTSRPASSTVPKTV